MANPKYLTFKNRLPEMYTFLVRVA